MTRFVGRWSGIDKQGDPARPSELVPVQYSRPMTAGVVQRDAFYGGVPPSGSLHHRFDSGSMAVWYDDRSGAGDGPPVGAKWVNLRDSRYQSRKTYSSTVVPNAATTNFDLSGMPFDGITTSGTTGTFTVGGWWLIVSQATWGGMMSFSRRAFLLVDTTRSVWRHPVNTETSGTLSVLDNVDAGFTFRVGMYQASGVSKTVTGTLHMYYLGPDSGSDLL